MMMNNVEIYEGGDLGCHYTHLESIFKVWAPTAAKVTLALYDDAGTYDSGALTDHAGGFEIGMRRGEGGVWSLHFRGDLAGKYYMYKVEHPDGREVYAADPYARAVSANGQRTAIVDVKAASPEGWDTDETPGLLGVEDSVLYELHVRDFSISPDSGLQYKGKFKAFTETGVRDAAGSRLGIDHLAELGVTHVHLLPIFDYATVNELTVNDPNSAEPKFNWGYDPQHYNVPEGSYATDPSSPEVRIRECKEMIMALHGKGIRVVMDVVYNHTYSAGDGLFEKLVPGYFYRTDASGRFSNGSGVGNELATERPMVRKYIKDSLRYWAEEYHIDGFRFDLMGLIDTDTIAQITEELRREHPGLLIYGEPWTGGETPLKQQTLKGSQRGKGFAVFNDNFRGAIKGDSDGAGKGFATGQPGKEAAVLAGVQGAIDDFTGSPTETINYVTVHDNLNLWDKVLITQGLGGDLIRGIDNGRLAGGGSLEEAVAATDPYRSIDQDRLLENESVRRALLANGIVLTSQGIPLIHAGDEMLRSKFGDHNSYRSGDAINAIRWSNKSRFLPVFEYYQGLIALRRAHRAFRMTDKEQIKRSMEVMRCDGNVIAYRLKDHANGDTWKNIIVIYNANVREAQVDIPFSITGWKVAVKNLQARNGALEMIVDETVSVPGLSVMVLYEEEGGRPRPLKTVELHYERQDRKYDGWNLWVWGSGMRERRVDFERMEDGRAVATIYVPLNVQEIGYIVRLNEWEAKDCDQDRFIKLGWHHSKLKVLVRSGSDDWKKIS
ncbi:type I pullulanase [Paenibacillus sp. OAE614]|uniref:type I pullulanase n=1 Tax=Paenibacillus sp. OAE614 TaxID=2663804 RepID=UPI0019DC4C22